MASSGDRSQKGSIGLENVKARVEQNQTGNGTQPDISAAVEPFRSRTYPDSGFESGFGLDFDKVKVYKNYICTIHGLEKFFPEKIMICFLNFSGKSFCGKKPGELGHASKIYSTIFQETLFQ